MIVLGRPPSYTPRMRLRRQTIASAPLLPLLLAAGCGLYSFSGSSLPSHIKTIAIPIMENKTLDYEVANEATEAITQRFIQDNRLKVAGESRADCVLEGQISSYEKKVYNYSASQTPEDYIVVIRVSATLRDAVKNREIWKQDPITVSAVYSVVPGSTQELQDETSARRKAIRDLAEDVLARTMEQW
jgi:hypothetical protein